MIQGTTVKLDTPEAIEQWIAERKKRFPTAERVEDKQKKLEEAVVRGQLTFGETRFPNKRRRFNDSLGGRHPNPSSSRNRIRGRGHSRSRGGLSNDGRLAARPSSVATEVRSETASKDVILHRTFLEESAEHGRDSTTSDSDSDGAPEIVSSKIQPVLEDMQTLSEEPIVQAEPKPVRKLAPRQPRRPLHNPFATRPALLHNVCLPAVYCSEKAYLTILPLVAAAGDQNDDLESLASDTFPRRQRFSGKHRA